MKRRRPSDALLRRYLITYVEIFGDAAPVVEIDRDRVVIRPVNAAPMVNEWDDA